MEKMLRVIATGRVALVAALVIVVLSLIPAGNWYHGLGIEGLDHYIAYFALSFLLLYGCQDRLGWAARMAGAMTLGLFIELVQPYFHRGMELPDVYANAAGIASGALLVLLVRAAVSFLHRHMLDFGLAKAGAAADNVAP
ncbi:MAG: hypothetical protein KDJ46_04095 [Rhodobiaceae bacterium]|nr:hypothetical protein [Rhodobiaceae bacterium]